jgi:hypothetical protein
VIKCVGTLIKIQINYEQVLHLQQHKKPIEDVEFTLPDEPLEQGHRQAPRVCVQQEDMGSDLTQVD